MYIPGTIVEKKKKFQKEQKLCFVVSCSNPISEHSNKNTGQITVRLKKDSEL